MPSVASTLAFKLRVYGLRLRRLADDAFERVARHRETTNVAKYDKVLAESRTPLWSEARPEERRLQLGKVQNLRLAVKHFNRVEVPAGRVISFWKQIGRTTSGKGYVAGRQLQEGCLIPVVGGGICQLSNALYDVALRAGCDIVERHGHSRVVPNSAAAVGRDATVAWNYVDLRFRAKESFVIEAFLTADELVIRLLATTEKKADLVPLLDLKAFKRRDTVANSCATCGQDQCFEHKRIDHRIVETRTVFLLDQVWPEFRAYVCEHGANDAIYLPLDATRFKAARYDWKAESFQDRVYATIPTLYRSWKSRKLAQQGPARRKASFESDEALAAFYARRLKSDMAHLVVTQALLPFLWRDGLLGGRTFDVLMTRLPIDALQAELDKAFDRAPEQKLLSDFRAPDWIVTAESEALAAANKIVTPHSMVAGLFGDRAEKIPWSMPAPREIVRGRTVVFPGPTVSRKGAYELRQAARDLEFKLTRMGSDLEGPDFWEGIDCAKPGNKDWLNEAAVVVAPSVVEDQPRRLLEAIACGVPVIATEACGLGGLPGVSEIKAGDIEELKRAISTNLG